MSSSVFSLSQLNGYLLRCQVQKVNGVLVLWVAESEAEVWTVSLSRLLSLDSYPLKDVEGGFTLLMLYLDENEDPSTIEFGQLEEDGVKNLILWLIKGLGEHK